jgi:Fe-S-cluster-containing hydrogenase component 2
LGLKAEEVFMGAKLVIDLAKCDIQDASEVQCSYKHHPENKGIDALLEMIRFALICRRCEEAPCINACPQSALEKIPSETNDAGILKRANMLCTGCGEACKYALYRLRQLCDSVSVRDDIYGFDTISEQRL